MLPGKKYTIEDAVRILRRGWVTILLPLVMGTAAGIAGHRWLPAQYQSETVIIVIPQRIPDSYVKSTVSANVEDRLRSVSEQILSRSRLERIIKDFDLYKAQRQSGLLEDVVKKMTNDINVKLEGKESSFRLTYISPDPDIAQKVTERLAALFIEENLRDRENLADSTNNFLEAQVQDAKRRLIEQEKKLEEYRRRYAGQLPSQLQGNLQSIQNAQMQLQSLHESMNRTRERRLLIERQLAEAQTLPAEVIVAGAGGTSAADAAPMSAAQQLEKARARLEVLKLRYTQDHPDVLAQEQAIKDLQVRVEAEALRPTTGDSEQPRSASEVARQKRLRDLRGELAMVDRQLASAQAEEGRLKKTMADVSGRIEVVPTRESELVELTRDYSTLQETYSTLLQKREDSKLAANLERRQIGEQFRILDPASRPERPYNQKQRLAILFGGSMSGLAFGLLLVGFREYRDASFACEDDVVRVLSLPVLALIPVMDEQEAAPGLDRRGRKGVGRSGLLLVIRSAAERVVAKLQT